jgi:hypothetical protein
MYERAERVERLKGLKGGKGGKGLGRSEGLERLKGRFEMQVIGLVNPCGTRGLRG